MMLYRNKKTGVVVRLTSRIISDNWEPIVAPRIQEAAEPPEKKPAKKNSRGKKA